MTDPIQWMLGQSQRKRGPGRPFSTSQETRDAIWRLVRQGGMSEAQIAQAVGVKPHTVNNLKRRMAK